MSNRLEFNEESTTISNRKKAGSTGIIGLLIRNKIVKNEQQANFVLLTFIVVGICLIIYINLKNFGG